MSSLIQPRTVALVSLHGAAVALAAWVGSGSALGLAAASALAVIGTLVGGRHLWRQRLAGIVLLAALLAAFVSQFHLSAFARAWPERSVGYEGRVQEQLAQALDGLLLQSEAATAELADRWSAGSIADPPRLPAALRRAEVDALALFGPGGELLAWDGSHRGPVPEEARSGQQRYLYEEGALFGYLYVTQPVSGGGTAIAAALLKSGLPESLALPAEDFEGRFREDTGAEIQVARGNLPLAGSSWDLEWAGESLLSVSLSPPSEAEGRSRIELRWYRLIALLILLAWGASVWGAASDRTVFLSGGVALPVLLAALPLAELSGWTEVFSPADLMLPGPVPLTLGHLLAFGLAGAVVLGIVPPSRRPSIPRTLAAAVGALLALGVLFLLGSGASRDLLAGGQSSWLAYQAATAALLLLSFAVALRFSADPEGDGIRPMGLVLWLGFAAVLSLVWVGLVGRVLDPPWWLPLLWGGPLLGVARSVAVRDGGFAREVLRWGALVILAVTLALPWAWESRVDAQRDVAEEQVRRLGTSSDPFLEFLLLRAGEQAISSAETSERAVEILYSAWTDSGLAMEGFPLWVTYWSPDDIAQEELRIGVVESRPPLPEDLVSTARESGEVIVRRFDLADAHYVSAAVLPGGALFSVVVPPRRLLGGASPLGPLFSPARSDPDPLVLIPLLPGELPGETEGLQWVATAAGWQGETFSAYPDEVYHAHYRLDLPGNVLLLARGWLILLLSPVLLGLPWGLGRWMRMGSIGPLGSRLAALSSFRARVTLALFGFFLIPLVAFGTLAARTLASAAVRTAESLAARAAEDAASWYFEVDGAVDLLANRVGSDLLLYEGGDLVAGSLPELVELGLYEGWMPASVQQILDMGESASVTATTSLGDFEYVVAYRRMPDRRVLAAPAPLQAGATALRQRDVADLIGFAVVLGGVVSVLLALLVGRALARPIQTLSVASERVGGGNMSVRLPERRKDEFGAVFDAFNRMVDRLADARKALVRSSRRTRAIMEEVPTGVVALDRRGEVSLVSSRVESLLGIRLERGHPVPRGSGPEDPRSVLADWLEGYFRDELSEAGTELSFGDRRIRVRARRISRRGPLGGAVLTLEDVTDELRSERILAWGEMAQQVAHEVKNPLTPIKLGVQHIQRAWTDGQPDYDAILTRNVDAILGEIERLATIASSFSTYGAPTPAGRQPLERVDVAAIGAEVLELYGAGGGPLTFTLGDCEEVPAVSARAPELKEVLVNLLENARAALPGRGGVEIEIELVDGEVELRVRDDGIGVPSELLGRIFEPHFSTHAGGTGLGLAIVRRLVESWGGRVHAESEPGVGTVIRIRMLPWSEEREAVGVEGPTRGRGDSSPEDG